MLRAYRVVAGVALGVAALLSLPSSALASPSPEDATRAWGVWLSDGTAWLAAAPGDSPPDGSVVGWRFSVAPDGTTGEPPGGDLPSFEAVCGRDTAGSGHKRVVLAVDFGDAEADAHRGERPPAQAAPACVAGAEDATTAQLLAAASQVRVDVAGGVTSVDGYPATPPQGGTALTAAPPPAGAGGPPTLLIVGGAGALALLAAGTAVATRRRTKAGSGR
ncbi:SCO2322 family protein [Nonomuraea sp. NPDC050202]|uniref:SCO2322 family protein n=1 Tax=Nonomuraea sp. NPDC050202 TaxID=3155035 RepID=UPI0033E153D2